jgi:hypothetical protein
MPVLNRKTPCAECPYRRDSLPGHLDSTGEGPQYYVGAALADYADFPVACHCEINYNDPEWRRTQYPTAPLCAGALIFARNQAKAPRDPQRAGWVEGVQPSDSVFRYPHELVEHHGGQLTEEQRRVKDLVEGRDGG